MINDKGNEVNERIKELSREAGLLAYNPEGPPTKLEKFAELIVRKCAELFEVEYGTSEVSGNQVARVLKEHFGVE
jgi:hypothetical protein